MTLNSLSSLAPEPEAKPILAVIGTLLFYPNPDRPTERPPFWFPGSDLLDTLCKVLNVSEAAIDLVDLSTCSDIVAHFVVRDGQVISEKVTGEFAQFQQRDLKTREELKQSRHVQREKVLRTLAKWGM